MTIATGYLFMVAIVTICFFIGKDVSGFDFNISNILIAAGIISICDRLDKLIKKHEQPRK